MLKECFLNLPFITSTYLKFYKVYNTNTSITVPRKWSSMDVNFFREVISSWLSQVETEDENENKK